MLRLFTGAAGSGKTRRVMEEIRDAVRAGQGGVMLIVPEQYSHEAERELCRTCGGSLSLYAEALSFSALARKLSPRRGDAPPLLDKGGRLLCMALALDGLSSRLGVYGAAGRRPELQSLLLKAVDEMKTSCVSSEDMLRAAAGCPGSLGDKLRDVALVSEAYDAVAANGRADPSDTLTLLAQNIPAAGFDGDTAVYIDGFIDFTAQEMRVVEALIKTGARVTVCLNADDSENEAFAPSRAAARRLADAAKSAGAETQTLCFAEAEGKAPELKFFGDNMFSYTSVRFEKRAEGVLLYLARSVDEECELAAARCIALVRDTGCRWRDIAVCVRGFEDYRQSMERAFEHYGVPLFITRKTDILSKPLPSLISGAYEIISGGFDPDDVTAYLRTGLAGLTPEETDELENYVFLWRLRGNAWTREGDWRQHPDGYGGEYDEKTRERLKEINALRRRTAEPLKKFMQASENAVTAAEQAAALSGLFGDIGLAQTLAERSRELCRMGREELAMEYGQLWELAVSALEQTRAVLGDMQMDRETFGRLYTLVLSQYDVGTIPVSLDRVSAGDFDRMRRRNIKHLIVLGASDDRVPMASDESGVFSADEKRRLTELDLKLGDGGEDDLWREFSIIYNTLTLPKETLTMCYSSGGDGVRPSFVMNRARALFDIPISFADADDIKTNAPSPAMELAAMGLRNGGESAAAALAVMSRRMPKRTEMLQKASEISRGRLSPEAVRTLYGERLRLSASRIDKFASCRFAYFVQYGLKAKVREPAGFTPPEIGTFMHFVLQHAAEDVMARGGFGAVDDGELDEITEKYIALYVREELNDFHEKSSRFRYLFTRLTKDVRRVIGDMAEELRRSDFAPLDFELDFGGDGRIKPADVGGDKLAVTGIADRVDGWVHDGKLYLRVVDYKTGRKKFDLSDVWYGMGLQMLLYLFTLQKNGAALYGRDIVPAGVMYVPARDVILSSGARLSPEEIESKRASEKRRSGLVLNDAQVLDAMEHGDAPRYIPVKFKNGVPGGDALATAEEFGVISRHIDRTLRDMAGELRGGSIAANPYYRSQQENACLNCDYFDVCHFSDGECGENLNYEPKLKPDEAWQRLKGGNGNG